jgi:hypothetical protein
MILYALYFNGRFLKVYTKSGTARGALALKAKWQKGDWEIREFAPNGVFLKVSEEDIKKQAELNSLKDKVKRCRRRIKNIKFYIESKKKSTVFTPREERQRDFDIANYQEDIINTEKELAEAQQKLKEFKK